MSQSGTPSDNSAWRLSPPPDVPVSVPVAMSSASPSEWCLAEIPQSHGAPVEVARALREAPEVGAARTVAAQVAAGLTHANAFGQLDPTTQDTLLRDLQSIQQALNVDGSGLPITPSDLLARAQETPNDFMRRRAAARLGSQPPPAPVTTAPITSAPNATASPTAMRAATETLAARAGALVDEIDFPAFVAGLVHGTFDAIVDATIRQMEAFASLVSAVAKDVDQFTRENVTSNQVRDWLVERYPGDLLLDQASMRAGQPRLKRRPAREEEDNESPAWLADFGMQGADLDDDAIEEQLLPAARRVVGEQRMQMLAAMVLMGMSRIVIRDGTISARVKFRAAARDHAAVDFATGQDPGGGGGWAARGSAAYGQQHATMVSTVSANVQTDTLLDASLYGEVKINFASETLPLDRFVDSAQLALLQRNSRPTGGAPTGPTTPSPQQVAPQPIPVVQPATPAPAAQPAPPAPVTVAPAQPTPAPAPTQGER